MRQIKFRAWDKNEIILWPFIIDINQVGTTIITKDMTWANVVLMQYTGLKDKNGKEIYEGDIMQESFEGITIRGKVHYEMSMFIILPNNKKWFPLQEPSDWEVIGNIYENPELLKL